MQIGLYLTGTKGECLALIDKKAEAEKIKFAKQCKEYQIHTHWDNTDQAKPIPVHASKPIKDEYSGKIVDNVVAHFKEQVADLLDDEECSLSFQITIHRRNPK